MEQVQELTEFVLNSIKPILEILNPTIVLLTPGITAGVLKLIYQFYPEDLNDFFKMAIATLVGGVCGLGLHWYGLSYETFSEAFKMGILSGLFATTSYAAHLNAKKKS